MRGSRKTSVAPYTCSMSDDVELTIARLNRRVSLRVAEFLTTQLSLDQKPDTLVVVAVPPHYQAVYEVLSRGTKMWYSLDPDKPAIVIRYFKGDLDREKTPMSIIPPPSLARR